MFDLETIRRRLAHGPYVAGEIIDENLINTLIADLGHLVTEVDRLRSELVEATAGAPLASTLRRIADYLQGDPTDQIANRAAQDLRTIADRTDRETGHA